MRSNNLRSFTFILAALILVLSPIERQTASAMEPLRCTTRIAPFHPCGDGNCDKSFDFAEGSYLPAGAVNGAWITVQDPLTGDIGVIASDAIADCAVQGWMSRPVIPGVGGGMRDVYQRGIAVGNNPAAFSKVGDCQNVVQFFLSGYDRGEYNLGPYADALDPVVAHFKGSFQRYSAAVDNGFNVASVLSNFWADKRICENKENPLECEERLHNPSIAIVSMETWWGDKPASEYADYLRRIVAFWLDQGVVPILATKADNLEGDHSINAAIVAVADEYGVPVWNFWLAAQSLPNHGMTDNFHLSYAQPIFGDTFRLRHGWSARNLTALQALDTVWRGVR